MISLRQKILDMLVANPTLITAGTSVAIALLLAGILASPHDVAATHAIFWDRCHDHCYH